MDISINKIVPADEISIDTEIILERLRENPEIVVFEHNQPQFVIISLNEYYTRPNPSVLKTITAHDPSNIKIGKLVQETLRRMFYKGLLPEEEINRMCTAEYSNNSFNLNFPMLKEYNPEIPFDEQKRDQKGYNRYYSFTLSAYAKQYLLCSQWIEHLHREKFEEWLSIWDAETAAKI